MSAFIKMKHFPIIVLLLSLSVLVSSQTISSLIQPGMSLPAGKQGQFEALIRKMDSRLQQDPDDYEAQLLKSILNFHLGKPEVALNQITRLTTRAPDFHLAHLVRADLIVARVKTLSDIGNPGLMSQRSKDDSANLAALREEVIARLKANLESSYATKIPAQLLQLSPAMKIALLVDKSRNRLYLYERAGSDVPPRLLKDFYVSTGQKRGNKLVKGDLRTPEGVYFITSWLADDKLPEKYGIGAFPTNYPNTLDRKLGKTGDGIWLHGTERIYYSRPPLDSEGCVVLSNVDLASIKQQIKPGTTPIIIADRIDWISQDKWFAMRSQILETVESWRRDWESLDVDRYLGHYGSGFWNSKHDLASWKKYKRRVAKQKTHQKIALNELALFYYPKRAAGKDMVLIRFKQDYRSNNFNSKANKKIYLSKEDTDWKIIYEGK